MTPDQRQYAMDHPKCEYCPHIGRKSGGHKWRGGLELEHVWQRMGGKIDHPMNWLMACPPCHRWKHRYPVLGRIVAMWVQWDKARRGLGEWDRETVRELVGKDPIGWLEWKHQTEDMPLEFEVLVIEMLESH